MAAQGMQPRRAAVLAFVALAAAAGGVVAAGAPAIAASTTRYVATSGDDTENDCTDQNNPCEHIQYAVNQANSGDTVSIAPGAYAEAVHIRKSLTLAGAGATGSGATSISGDDSGDPSIWLDGIDTNEAPQLQVQDVSVSGNEDNDGILAQGDGATVGVADSVVDNNDADGVDVLSGAAATVNNTTVSGNGDEGVATNVDRDAIDSGPPSADVTNDTISQNADGGIVSEIGTITVDSTTIDHNVGAGVVADGAGTNVVISFSTVSGTQPFAQQDGGGTFGGGVLVFPGGDAAIGASTIAGNVGQGVLALGADDVTIGNSTISGTLPSADSNAQLPYGGVAVASVNVGIANRMNRSFFGHGHGRATAHVARANVVNSGSTTLTATITSDNGALADCVGTIVDGGYNLAGDDSCAFTAKGSVDKGVAKLGSLADNGGPTKTLLPAKGSDAIDAIPAPGGNGTCPGPDIDQRGVTRPQGPACDIGAVEVAQTPIVISPGSLPHGEVGKPYSATFTATGGLGAPYVWSLASDSDALPAGLELSPAGVISGTPTAPGTYVVTVSVDDPVVKDFTIVVKAAPLGSVVPPKETNPGSGQTTLPFTGSYVGPLGELGGVALGLGLLLLAAAGRPTGGRRRHRG